MAPKQLKLWELAGDNANWSFSPFVWRVRFALAYKRLPYEYQAWRFTEKELIKPCTTARADIQVADRLVRCLAILTATRTDSLAINAGTNFGLRRQKNERVPGYLQISRPRVS